MVSWYWDWENLTFERVEVRAFLGQKRNATGINETFDIFLAIEVQDTINYSIA